jgi:hypothetical protein
VRGHKSNEENVIATPKPSTVIVTEPVEEEAPHVVEASSYEQDEYDDDVEDDSTVESDEDSEEEEEEEEDDELQERRAILADCRNLKFLASAYLHPEAPVKSQDPTVFARCYFSRASAPFENEEEVEERAQVLAEAAALKKLAVDYLHPENPVVCIDSTATARCYFDRASAMVEDDDAAERAQVLADVAALKKLTADYLHPETPVACSDPCATARCFFNRASAALDDDAEERAQVLADAAALKKLAVDYLHPEKPVECSDPCATAHCFFDRPSAIMQEDDEERAQVLADAAALKKLAVDYLHPEAPVVADATATARCFFDRPSAVADEDAEEHAQVLAEAAALKKLAADYLHPEKPVVCTDATVFARNYFTRPSAVDEEDEERVAILAEAAALKKLAVDCMHPEKPVVCTDFTSMARNYFTRPSAPVEDNEEERAAILAETAALKKLAADYMHPELPVVCTDSTAFGRNYFTRPSAPEEEDEERAAILAEAAALKKLAVDYMHPEKPVVCTDSTASARNYFTRPSAPIVDDEQERAEIMAEALALKELAGIHLHPERPVVCTDATAMARNFFTRPSAPVLEDEQERALILAEMAALKKLAVDYMHPELPVVCTDPCARSRCYFERASAPEQDHPVEAAIAAHAHASGVNFEQEVMEDIRQTINNKFQRSHSFGKNEATRMFTKEEEGHLSRSPSSVMLFDLGGAN